MTWIPVDQLAKAVLDLVVSEKRLPALINVVNPSPISWEEVMSTACTVLGVTLRMVPFREWIEKLEIASENPDTEAMESIVSTFLDLLRRVR